MIDGAVAYGLLIPFAGTSLGAAMVFLLRRDMSARVRKLLLGFASGVMMAASVWSLLLPAIDRAAEGALPDGCPPRSVSLPACSRCCCSIRWCRTSI